MLRLRALLALGLCALASITASCTKDAPAGPTAIAPSPSPTPTPDPRLSCAQADLKLVALNGAGNPDITFAVAEPINVLATPTNEGGFALPSSCNYSRVAGWAIAGPTCVQFGDLTGLSAVFFCAESGDLSVTATHERFKSFLRLRIVR